MNLLNGQTIVGSGSSIDVEIWGMGGSGCRAKSAGWIFDVVTGEGMNKPEFAYEHYCATLADWRDRFGIRPLCEWDKSETGILLRHDVDFDIGEAHTMAVLERDLGVRSTYFILMTSPNFNPFTKLNRSLLNAIASFGHEIGLHFDPSIYEDDGSGAEVTKEFHREEQALASILGQEHVNSVSIHHPSVHGGYPLYEGFVNAYDPEMFGRDRYLSESRQAIPAHWDEVSEKASMRRIQVLVHPTYWSAAGDPWRSVATNLAQRVVGRLDQGLRNNDEHLAAFSNDTILDSLLARG